MKSYEFNYDITYKDSELIIERDNLSKEDVLEYYKGSKVENLKITKLEGYSSRYKVTLDVTYENILCFIHDVNNIDEANKKFMEKEEMKTIEWKNLYNLNRSVKINSIE